MLKVAYVTGRRKALARALALEAARLQGVQWSDMKRSEQRRLVREADIVIGIWIDNEVFTEYAYERRANN